ncbi:hypothetical protein CAPSP0001_0196 [Capnocytophaga sputigena ATCC 33612]|nr:hypothetical protein CAPSP0001_0196 [Capnocytophaga sputigena ATCC 33612]
MNLKLGVKSKNITKTTPFPIFFVTSPLEQSPLLHQIIK